MPDSTLEPARRCARCGAALGRDAESLCPACLLEAAHGPESASDLTDGSITRTAGWRPAAAPAPPWAPRLSPGQTFGPYRIERLLGWGGMGEVYAAEHVADARRVAIKLLAERLASGADRARFLREGQLAASITHPNSVYVFGSEVIDGTQVIAMELVQGGTLRDRVERDGPMPSREAVDAILQVISGLDAAQAAGILHRDVKPSNCFIDTNGTVKVGDFGLSIPSIARGGAILARGGSFQGTPAFASPEQLRGEPLDVRSDIYSVGVTLYYLLTGATPFDAPDLMALAARIAADEPRRPGVLAPEVPAGLEAVVLRCLQKDPGRRPAGYAALARALRPFSSEVPPPAGLRRRTLAGAIDFALLGVSAQAALWLGMYGRQDAPSLVAATLVQPIVDTGYFALLEGLRGRSLGKWLVGLRVVRSDGGPAGPGRALVRAATFPGLADVAAAALLSGGVIRLGGDAASSAWSMLVALGLIAVAFGSARRRNGLAGLHDLASGTRVVREATVAAEGVATPVPVAAVAPVRDLAACGPYQIVGSLGRTGDGDLLLAHDPALGRDVWIHRPGRDAPPVPAGRRDLGRPARLRWLGGRRENTEAWDAYEAPGGAVLGAATRTPRPWSVVRGWLVDLAEEAADGLAGGAAPPAASTSRVWIGADGRARWLDFPAPGSPDADAAEASSDFGALQRFLGTVAARALGGDGPPPFDPRAALERPLPLHARSLVERLLDAGFEAPADLLREARDAARRPSVVPRARRAAHLALPVLGPAVAVLVVLSGVLLAPGLDGGASPPPERLPREATLFFLNIFERVVLMAVAASAFFQGGAFFAPLGMALVDARGRRASRVRALVRGLVAWSPALVAITVAAWPPRPLLQPIGVLGVMTVTPTAGLGLRLALLAACALAAAVMVVAAVRRPDRSLQDVVAGTWIVPR